jgi:hypothetical protein
MAHKHEKDEVDYVGHAVDGHTCRTCTMFRSPRGCTDVEGKISPDGHCEIFADAYAKMEQPLSKAIKRAMALDQGE